MTYAQLVTEVKQLSSQEQLLLLEEIARALYHQTAAQLSSDKDARLDVTKRLRGAFRSANNHALTDDWKARKAAELTEKYG